jgi:hypothetical protein
VVEAGGGAGGVGLHEGNLAEIKGESVGGFSIG